MISWSDWVLMGRVALAAALGFVIGWERESRGHPAGDRTYALLALGAALFTALGLQVFPAGADKLVAGLVTGVGFLAGGVILRSAAGEIRGLTTAASMWAVAGIGAVVGTGRYLLGVLLAGLVLLILVWEKLPVLSRFGHGRKDATAPRQDE